MAFSQGGLQFAFEAISPRVSEREIRSWESFVPWCSGDLSVFWKSNFNFAIILVADGVVYAGIQNMFRIVVQKKGVKRCCSDYWKEIQVG